MISLMLILCFMDRLSHPLVGIFLCLFGILLCGIYGALPKAGIPERQKKKEKEKENEKENKISSFYAFSVLFCLVVSILSLVIGLILAITGYGEASYICAAIFGVSFTAFLLGSWWKPPALPPKPIGATGGGYRETFKSYDYGNTSIKIQSGPAGGAQCYLLFAVRTFVHGL